MPRIAQVETWLIEIPTRRPHKLAYGDITAQQMVMVRTTSGDGASGWGEATVNGGPTWSEESGESIFLTLNRYLIPHVLGRDTEALEQLRLTWSARVRGNPFAKAALEMSIVDLRARSMGVSAAQLLGGVVRTRVPLSWSIAAPTLEEDIEEATRMVAGGHRIFKIKAGSRPVQEDLKIIHAVREAVGPEISLRVDANQGWSRRDAFVAVDALADVGLAFLEQPLVREDFEGLALLQRRSTTPLLADESITTLREAVALASMDAVRAFAFKLAKHGGFMPAMHIAAFARTMGIGCYVGCMIETGVGTAAYAQFCASLPVLEYGCELFGPMLLVDDIVAEPIRFEPGQIVVPGGPGLGVAVDMDKLSHYTREGWHATHQAG